METLLHNFIQATGWSILHSLWQSALIFALLLPTQLQVFRLNAKLKYALAYAAKCLMFLCFVYTFFSIFHLPATQHLPSGLQHIVNGDRLFQTAVPLTLSAYTESLFPYVVLLYSLGLMIQTFIVYKGYTKVQSLRNAAHIEVPEEWSYLFTFLKRELKINKAIDFHLSDQVTVPLVIGFLKPVILFPMALAAQMDMKHLEAILIHELSHIRRNDYLLNLIRTMIDTLLFFNPFVWLTGRFINIEREHACDDLVIKLTNTPLTYAHALLQLELLTDKNKPVLALAATGTNQHLYQRIKRITDMKTNYANSKQKLFAVTLTIATIISLAWINPVKKEKNSKPALLKGTVHTPSISTLILQDTGKKKAKKTPKAKKVETTAIYTTIPDVPLPPLPPEPVSPPAIPDEVAVPPVPPIPDINVITDFAISVTDMVNANTSNNKNLKKMQDKLEKRSKELEKSFNSPEQQAKWKKYSEELEARFNSPEQQEKWKKYGEAMQAKYNSAEERDKWKKYADDIRARYNSAEERAKWQKMAKTTHTFKYNQDAKVIVISKNDEVEQSPEYKALKSKFEKDLQDLYNKKNKKEGN